MNKSKKRIMTLIVMFVFVLTTSSLAMGATSSYVVKNSAGDYFQYDLTVDFYDSYDYYMFVGQGDPSAQLFKHYMDNSTDIVAYRDSVRGYIDFYKLLDAYDENYGNPSFNLDTYMETQADLYTGTISISNVSMVGGEVTVGGAFVINQPAPTASAFSIGGDAGVTTVNGTVVGNEITFAVDPTATYTTAGVTLSQDVHVTVTKAGEATPSRTDILAEAGDLNVDVGLLSAFAISKTSATGAELIAQTPADSAITVLLKSAADATKTTTYTVKFVAQ